MELPSTLLHDNKVSTFNKDNKFKYIGKREISKGYNRGVFRLKWCFEWLSYFA